MAYPTHVRRLDASDSDCDAPIDRLAFEIVLTARLAPGDLVLCVAGDVIPADGTIVEGAASFAEASPQYAMHAALGHAPPRVYRGTRVLTGYVVVRIGAWTASAPREFSRNLYAARALFR